MMGAANVSPPTSHRASTACSAGSIRSTERRWTAAHAFAHHGGKIYSNPEANRVLALTIEFFKQHLGS
jgi:hypothetical protein